MKTRTLIAAATIFIISCKKDVQFNNYQSTYLINVKSGLKDSLTVTEFAAVDFPRSIITKTDQEIRLLRIPFIGKKLSEKFLLLQTNTLGKISTGSIIKLHRNVNENDNSYGYNGTINISYLNGAPNINSEIKNGYITAFRERQVAQRSLVVPSTPREYYPEVIAGYYSVITNGSIPSYYINLSGLTSGGAESAPSRYSSMEGTGKGDEQNIEEDEPFVVDFEYVEGLSPIDLSKYLKCFSNIPDNGSTCSIEILVDIPVDGFPNRTFNYEQGSPGHTFLKITKTKGSQSVSQNIGFYPNSSWKMLFTNPVENKIVDNGEHEFNASLKMDITPEQMNGTLDLLNRLSHRDYDIDDYNCTDFALEIFNHSRIGNPIEIQRNAIWGGSAEHTSVPGELYKTLASMKQKGIESDNISLPETKAFVGNSSGPCN